MSYLERYNMWLTDEYFDSQTRKELSLVTDEKEKEDRFYRDLEFGTGGLRGIMGAGTNRMNIYTIGKATTGLGKYLLYVFGKDVCRERGVAVAYDTRNNSREFAKTTADVLSDMGIKVYLSTSAVPTPQLSYTVHQMKTVAGVVITASHNPKEYNGYKVYDEYGCQLTPEKAEKVLEYIESIKDYRSISFKGQKELIEKVDTTERFVDKVLLQSRIQDIQLKKDLNIVYTPLHGTGFIPVMKMLEKAGFTNVQTVKEQMIADGNFPTVISPNPEDRRALELGIKLAKKNNADIVLGTDPDSDRVGVAVKTKEGFELLTGNQIGALLMDFLLIHTDLTKLKKPAVVKTVVTSELGAEIARTHGLAVFSTLTGFKYIGQKINQFELAHKTGEEKRDFTFLFGYEESYGYLAGTHARDKDAVVAALLICEMAAFYKSQGKNLLEQMDEIYQKFGYYRDWLDSFTLKGKDGMEQISVMMDTARKDERIFADIEKKIDFSQAVEAEEGFGKLPVSNVVKFILEDGSWIAVRPSGTEPKIKIYYSIKGKNKADCEERLAYIRETMQIKLGLNKE